MFVGCQVTPLLDDRQIPTPLIEFTTTEGWPVPATRTLGFRGDRTIAPTASDGSRSPRGAQSRPRSRDLQTPPPAAPATMTRGSIWSKARESMRPAAFVGPMEVQT